MNWHARAWSFCLVVCVTAMASVGAVNPVCALDAGIEVPGGIDLDIINQPAPAGADGQTLENPLDRDFDAALERYRDQDFNEARLGWAELAEAEHGLSMHNLAVLMWRGQGGRKQPLEALELFRKAGEEQHVPQSLHALGVVYLHGAGVIKDEAEAVRFFEAAAARGYAPSTYNLALANFNGIGGVADKDLGMQLMEDAAEGGLVQAQYDLAGLLYSGTYGPADQARARKWFERAAAGGDPFAHYNLGLMQLMGEGGAVDAGGAYEHLFAAAEMGTVPAQMRLAHMLATGEHGAKRNLEAALMWMRIAAAFGAEGAGKNADRLAATLDPAAVKRAKAAAAKFRPRRPVLSAQPGTPPPASPQQ